MVRTSFLRKVYLVVCVLCAATLPALAQQSTLPDAPDAAVPNSLARDPRRLPDTPQSSPSTNAPDECDHRPLTRSSRARSTAIAWLRTNPSPQMHATGRRSLLHAAAAQAHPRPDAELPRRIRRGHPPPPTFKINFRVATQQAFDYSSFVFLVITSGHRPTGRRRASIPGYCNGGNAVLWAYTWRGFLDKTDGNYLAAFILPTILHEDTRYYAQGTRLQMEAARLRLFAHHPGAHLRRTNHA